MGRVNVTIRPAQTDDVEQLVVLWTDSLRRGSAEQRRSDVLQILAAAASTPDERVLVAEVDGTVAGVVHLQVTTLSPVNREPVVYAVAPHVHPQHRRHGVGTALMEAAVVFAEERQVALVGAAVVTASREANRFFARLSLGARATLRIASTQSVRHRLTVLRPERAGPHGSRQRDRILAARRVRRAERVS
ncbi:GNAT family N-acetyltransferase [Nocardioides campestrisoli]|uniref:GNAT family N-acetyltransferase n=1 Tax=Nocardioides campestrisoli TaxID=2736757 RepID=UPI0015E6C001|nr:GNAT family N-acetyltransferase [Nocardioides campestrisoli]